MPNPRIAIDGYNLALEQGTGVATYSRNLSYTLGAMGAEVSVLYGQRASVSSRDPILREIGLYDASPRGLKPFARFVSDFMRSTGLHLFGARPVTVPISESVIRTGLEAKLPYADNLWNSPELYRAAVHSFGNNRRLGRVSLPQAVEVMHWTYPLPLRVLGARNIYTLHDLVPLRMPYATLDHKRRYLRTCQAIIKAADHIVTVSDASKRDIMNLLGVPEEKISNTYQSVEIPARMANKPEGLVRAELAGAFGLPWQGYWLFFGAIEPKKNVGRLIESYLASGSTAPLVICGRLAWQMRQELGLLYEDDLRTMDGGGDGTQGLTRKLRDRVIMIDYVPFRMLVSLIRGARGVLFPSLYEGFGLPALEAMLLGTPVITANTSSLPEVVGDAAMTVDPYDTRALAEAIQALDADAGLRADYAQRGPRRAALFNRAAYGRRLSEMYAKIGVRLDAEPAVPALGERGTEVDVG